MGFKGPASDREHKASRLKAFLVEEVPAGTLRMVSTSEERFGALRGEDFLVTFSDEQGLSATLSPPSECRSSTQRPAIEVRVVVVNLSETKNTC